MTIAIEPFATADERARAFTEILRRGGATPGTTLVGSVDRATLEVVAVQSIATPAAINGRLESIAAMTAAVREAQQYVHVEF